MKSWFFLGFVVLLLGCQSSEEKVVTLDDLSKPSVHYTASDDTLKKKDFPSIAYDSIAYFSKKLVDTLGLPKSSIHRINSLLFPDRFNPVKSDKWYGVTPNDSFVYKHWMYTDTNVAENTYYNWLDNFGGKHLSLKFGDKVRVSPNAFVLLLQHRSVLLLESTKEIRKEKILPLLDTLGFGNTWKYVLFQNKGKKTEWYEKLNLSSENESSKP